MQLTRSLAPVALALVAATTTLGRNAEDRNNEHTKWKNSDMGAMHETMVMGKPAAVSATH
mgnify:CR=1 FL=1